MEIECSKCRRKFIAAKEDAELCPDCLKNEFGAVAASLDAEERAQLVAECQSSVKRQMQRAEVMGGAYSSGAAFSTAGKFRLGLGLFIFLVCCFLFLISDDESDAILRYVFRWGCTRDDLDNLVCTSGFSHRVMDYARAGGKFYESLGIFKK